MPEDNAKKNRRKAVAIRYDMDSEAAPKVIAKGSGYIAERIIEIAKENDVHIHEDPDLVGVLSQLELDTQIPPELYRALAEVLAFVYRLNKKLGAAQGMNNPG